MMPSTLLAHIMNKLNTISTLHPDYKKFTPRWKRVDTVLDGEDSVKATGEEFLPKTMGMRKGGADGKTYDSYRNRARIYGITGRAHTGIIGLMFEKDPLGIDDDIVTNTGLTKLQLAREVTRAVVARGRDILLVDSPANGGAPYIARYPAQSMTNWRVDETNPNRLTMAVFKEEVRSDPEDENSHETEDRWRRYLIKDGNVCVELFNSEGDRVGDEKIIAVPQEDPDNPTLPVFIAGSIDTSPACDPVPLLPTANCELSAYRLSADYMLSLWQVASPTPTVSGVNQEQYDEIIKCGIGPASLWYLGADGRAGFLEVTGGGIMSIKTAIEDEKTEAETNAVRLTTGARAESTETTRIKSSQQHASIYTIADCVSIAIKSALALRAKWGSVSEGDEFILQTDFSNTQAYEALITVIDRTVTSGNVPDEVLFNVLRKAGLTEKTDEELRALIKEHGPNLGQDFSGMAKDKNAA